MTPRQRAALAALCLGAFGLRLAVAVFDARRPLFPPHYYNDERDYLAEAARVNASRERGEPPPGLTPGKEFHIQGLALLGRAAGPGPLPGRVLNAAAAAAAAGLWGATGALVASPHAGLAAAAFAAFWPSGAFHSAQAGKEGPVALLLALAAWAVVGGLRARGLARHGFWAGSALAAVLLGLLRAYLPAVLAGAAVLAAALGALRPGPGGRRGAALPVALWLVLAAAAFRPVKIGLGRALSAEGRIQSVQILPSLPSPGGTAEPSARPLPRRLGDYRSGLLASARDWSLYHFKSKPESALFPDERIETWADLLLFVPRATFYELFMPLPGLYPMQGKPARMLAAAEGVVLLAAALLAAWALARRRWDPATAFLAGFFVLVSPSTAFLEFDLGSASRHRTHIYPFILPFAAQAALEAARRRR